MDDERRIAARISADKDWSRTKHDFMQLDERMDSATLRKVVSLEDWSLEQAQYEPRLREFIKIALQELMRFEDAEKFFGRLNLVNEIIGRIQDLIARTKQSGSMTVAEHTSLYFRLAMLDLQKQLLVQKLRSFFTKYGLEEQYDSDLTLVEFVECRTLVAEIDGISLDKIIDSSVNQLDLGKVFNFVLNAGRKLPENVESSKLAETLRPMSADRYTELARQYPATLVSNYSSIFNFFSYTKSAGPTYEFNERLTKSKAEKILARKMNRVIGLINELFREIRSSLTDEGHPAHRKLVEVYRRAMASDYPRPLIMHYLGAEEKNMVNLYRITKEFVQKGHEVDVFDDINQASLERLVNNPVNYDWLERDDLGMIFDIEAEQDDQSQQRMGALREKMNALFSIISTREYEIEPAAINWQKMVAPSELVIVQFDQQHHQQMNVLWTYASSQGETLSFMLAVDLWKKNGINWNCLESPTDIDPLIVRSKNIVLENLGQILDYLITQGKVLKAQKSTVWQNQNSSLPKRERGSNEVYQLRKEKQTVPVDLDREGPIEPKEDAQRGNLVEIDYQQLARDLRQLSEIDLEAVKRDIEEYNSRGVGKFKKLQARGRAGQKLYSLRVDCTTRAGIRVLLEEVPYQESTGRKFRAIAVGYRKDIYRQNGL